MQFPTVNLHCVAIFLFAQSTWTNACIARHNRLRHIFALHFLLNIWTRNYCNVPRTQYQSILVNINQIPIKANILMENSPYAPPVQRAWAEPLFTLSVFVTRNARCSSAAMRERKVRNSAATSAIRFSPSPIVSARSSVAPLYWCLKFECSPKKIN